MYAPNVTEATSTVGLLAATGMTGLFDWGWFALAFLVIGGVLTALSHFFPRIALESLRQKDGSYRMVLTKNGHRWSSRLPD